jgi:hypothetical protein
VTYLRSQASKDLSACRRTRPSALPDLWRGLPWSHRRYICSRQHLPCQRQLIVQIRSPRRGKKKYMRAAAYAILEQSSSARPAELAVQLHAASVVSLVNLDVILTVGDLEGGSRDLGRDAVVAAGELLAVPAVADARPGLRLRVVQSNGILDGVAVTASWQLRHLARFRLGRLMIAAVME